MARLSSVSALYKNLIHPQNTGNPQDTRMSRIFHPLLYMLACATKQELARQVHYLKTENQILRARLPRRIIAKPDER